MWYVKGTVEWWAGLFSTTAGWQVGVPVGEEQEGLRHHTGLEVWEELHPHWTGTADGLPAPETQMAASPVIHRTAICTWHT